VETVALSALASSGVNARRACWTRLPSWPRQCRTWVAVRDAQIMGYAALDGDMLEDLYLLPDARRQGIGTLLLDEVRQHSPDGVSLFVFQANTEARAFYERHGFTVFDTSDGDRNMENLPDMTLRWTPDSAEHAG
jgi:ribosomal protein S18 acetylase RimI-like enzyme